MWIDVLVELLDPNHFEIGKVGAYYNSLLDTIASQKEKNLKEKAIVFAQLPAYYQNIVSIANGIGATLIDQRKKNVMIIETSTGNSGASFAWACRALGFMDYHVVIPEDMPSARIEQIRSLGAKTILSPSGEYVRGLIDKFR